MRFDIFDKEAGVEILFRGGCPEVMLHEKEGTMSFLGGNDGGTNIRIASHFKKYGRLLHMHVYTRFYREC